VRVISNRQWLAAGLVWASAPLAGQEPVRGAGSWSGEAGLSYVQNSGNSETSTFGTSLKLFREQGPWRIGVGGAFLRSADSGVRTAERLDGLLRAERALGSRVSLYAQLGYLRNEFAGIDGSETLEAGGLYKLVDGPRHVLAASVSLAYDWEQRLSPALDRDFLGGRGGVSYRLKLSESAAFGEEIDYLQSFKEAGDGRLTSKATLTTAVNRVLALKLGDHLTYYNNPVPGKKKSDHTIFASIVARWPAPAPPPPPCPDPPPTPAS
jgi:putative salt-induced outer membrane protein YdiY